MSSSRIKMKKNRVDKTVVGYDVDSWLWRLGTTVVGAITLVISRILLKLLNVCTIINVEQLYRCVEDKDRAVITISNHSSLIDCLIIAVMTKFNYLFNPLRLVPWAPSAKDVVHRTWYGSLYMRAIKSLPLSRGGGVNQPVMDLMVERLNYNEWVYIFPEGKINKHKERIPYKTGIGRLITEPKNQPIILPIYMLGTDDVLPMKRPYFPRFGKRITVVVGEPVQFSDELMAAIKSRPAEQDTWTKIAEELHTCIDELQVKAKRIHSE